MKQLALISVILCLVISGGTARAQAPGIQNLQIFAAGDLVFPTLMDGSVNDNQLYLRSGELSIFGAVDPYIDATLTFAGHTEDGEFVYEVHEGFASSSKLIPRSRIKAGKFLLGVGRLNPIHQHDWPFVTAPKVQREFFNPGRDALAAEGAVDTGLEYSILLPTDFYLDITVGVTNGYYFGHTHDGGVRPKVPVHYLRPVTFFELGENRGLQVGLNYLGWRNVNDEELVLTGVDAAYKHREGRTLRWLLQSEVWHRAQNRVSGATSTVGGYVYPQYGWTQNLSFGLRFDGYSQLNRSFATTGQSRKDFDYALVPVLTYKPSEFSTLRMAYTHEVDTTQGDRDYNDRRIELQLVFLLGAHPAHDF